MTPINKTGFTESNPRNRQPEQSRPPEGAVTPTRSHLEERARSGRTEDIDFLMGHLDMSRNFSLCKQIDYALGLVSSQEGRTRIRYFLFNGGSQIQRNYAALYFKRRGAIYLLEEAFQQGCIDSTQAFSR